MSQVAFDLDLDDGGEPTYTVSELGEQVNGALRRRFSDGVWVRGEIQGWSERGPHAYFRLVEETEQGKAVVNVQFFAPARQRLRQILSKHRLALADGLKVRLFGHLDFFAPSGQLGLKMSGLDPRFTLGEMSMERDEVVRRLVASGLYDANRRLKLSPVPLRVGVVTSLSGAAWADFLHEIERSAMGFRLRTVDVRVQGEWAVPMITDAVRHLGRAADLDTVAVIRGGGARSELATFDHESIALAIAASSVPVFTGLGHEIDRSIADDVAHTSVKTPTACAAALVERVAAFSEQTELAWQAVSRRADLGLGIAVQTLAEVAGGIRHRTVAAVERGGERLDQRLARTRAAAVLATQRADQRIAVAAASVCRVPARLDPELRHLEALAHRVRVLDPVSTMARGWSITRTVNGTAVRRAGDLRPGDQLITTFAAGTARSTVEETTT